VDKLDPRDRQTYLLARNRFAPNWTYTRAGQYRIWRKPDSDGFVCLDTNKRHLVIGLEDGREITLSDAGRGTWRVADVLALAATYKLVEQR
jgi:hypothetical protein